MNLKTEVMVDLETLGTTPETHILSIGACTMDGANTFHEILSLEDQFRSINPKTVQWWMEQSSEAHALFKTAKVSKIELPAALEHFQKWLQHIRATTFWSHGVSFDMAILTNAYTQYGLPVPWNFWDLNDTRTIIKLGREKLGKDFPVIAREGTHHDALADALYQAEQIRTIIKML